jgi:hypothetical protein
LTGLAARGSGRYRSCTGSEQPLLYYITGAGLLRRLLVIFNRIVLIIIILAIDFPGT